MFVASEQQAGGDQQNHGQSNLKGQEPFPQSDARLTGAKRTRGFPHGRENLIVLEGEGRREAGSKSAEENQSHSEKHGHGVDVNGFDATDVAAGTDKPADRTIGQK